MSVQIVRKVFLVQVVKYQTNSDACPLREQSKRHIQACSEQSFSVVDGGQLPLTIALKIAVVYMVSI